MLCRILWLVATLATAALAGEFDAFVHLSPEEQVDALGRATPEERLQMMRAIKAVMETDPLTGLRNRRSLSRMSTNHDLVAFISFDLDHFKKINDTYGHDVGDEVLRKVSEVARASVREPVFRLGGEEFLVILQGASADEARIVAERIRSNLEAARFEKIPALRVTGSFGVAAGRSDSDLLWNALMKASDEASYESKRSGRNRVTLAAPNRACEIVSTLPGR